MTRARDQKWPRLPLVTQVMGLVLVTLVSAIAVHAAIALLIPPPPPEFYRMSELVSALRTPDKASTARNGHVLVARVADQPINSPAPLYGGRVLRWLAHDLATQFGVGDDLARIDFPNGPGPAGRRYIHAMRSQMGPPPMGGPQGPGAEDHGPDGERGPPPPRDGLERPHPPEPFDLPHPLAGSPDGGHVPFHGPGMIHGDPFIIAPFVAQVQRPDGRWAILNVHETGLLADWRQRVLLGFLLSFVLLGPIAFLFARWLAAPMTAFAQAADRLGRDPGAPPLQIRGSSEVSLAAAAFNQMQDRIRRYVQDRTEMIGSVAHDLRTPLTRLKFRIEQAPDELREKLTADIDEMERMIAATLAFVRDASQSSRRERIELRGLLAVIVAEMREMGIDVTLADGPPVQIDGDPMGLRRVFGNLIENAVKFGKRARVTCMADRVNALIDVDDDGPGVDEALRDRVFEPFVRIEPSRNRETGGAGLGLAVVRSVSRAHGGDAQLINLQGGGLRARVTLPLPRDLPPSRDGR